MLVFVRHIFQEDVHEDMLCALLLPVNITAAELLKSLNDDISGKLVTLCRYMHGWSGCHDWMAFCSLLGSEMSLLNVSLREAS